ncbi:hypothetical protein [Chitinophaga vietnamensis]|uniref:hypothetical protein n=1 Tax=Chitinophaga vietnamensis TaxID=2593957 RepID=UPI001177B722|nr:hypothetical protein [Chitinophaga vietnamensis]
MNLSAFITALIREGQVAVAHDITPFPPEALQEATAVLHSYYLHDISDMPADPPAFDPEAALWAAIYVFRTTQLIMLKTPAAEQVSTLLLPYPGAITAAAIYSADLCLRYLPDLLSMSKGLAPDDPLLTQLRQTAAAWPYSSTGMQITPAAHLDIITGNSSLLQAYADRVIATRDISRCNMPAVTAAIVAALGNYQEILWPDFRLPLHHR